MDDTQKNPVDEETQVDPGLLFFAGDVKTILCKHLAGEDILPPEFREENNAMYVFRV